MPSKNMPEVPNIEVIKDILKKGCKDNVGDIISIGGGLAATVISTLNGKDIVEAGAKGVFTYLGLKYVIVPYATKKYNRMRDEHYATSLAELQEKYIQKEKARKKAEKAAAKAKTTK